MLETIKAFLNPNKANIVKAQRSQIDVQASLKVMIDRGVDFVMEHPSHLRQQAVEECKVRMATWMRNEIGVGEDLVRSMIESFETIIQNLHSTLPPAGPTISAQYVRQPPTGHPQAHQPVVHNQPAPQPLPPVAHSQPQAIPVPVQPAPPPREEVRQPPTDPHDLIGHAIEAELKRHRRYVSYQGYKVGPRSHFYVFKLEKTTVFDQVKRMKNNLLVQGLIDEDSEFEAYKGFLAIKVDKQTPDKIYIPDFYIPKTYKPWEEIKIQIGLNQFGELVEMPLRRILIAGSSGGGKNGAIDTILYSLTRTCPPSQIQFAIVDPKQLDFHAFTGMSGVDQDLAYHASHYMFEGDRLVGLFGGTYLAHYPDHYLALINLTVDRMNERFAYLRQNACKDVWDFNRKFPDQHLPIVVLVEDELGLIAASEVAAEYMTLRNKILTAGRAAGFLIISATQNPRKEVLDALTRPNYDVRVGFWTTKNVSKIIYGDEFLGATTLKGAGDSFVNFHNRYIRTQVFYSDHKALRSALMHHPKPQRRAA